MSYSRKIAYFDLLDQGEKKGNAGFCKWEQRNDRHILAVLVNGVPKSLSERYILYSGRGKELGSIDVADGRGECVCHLQEGHDWTEELSSVRISFPHGLELNAEFQPENRQMENTMETENKGLQEVLLIPEEKEEEPEEKEEAAEGIPFWNWMMQTHQRVRPFGTKQEYFRISIEDIYRLKDEYHALRNNQFLLHGYYNYHYLIMGKKEDNEQECWIGVPGIYHEREKMAARMYGFEKFEGASPSYRTGDLGYYLITVKAEDYIEKSDKYR